MKHVERAREIIETEIEGLRKVRAGLGKEFDRAVEIFLKALNSGHKIVVTGVGKNLPIGQKIASTLTSTGSPSVFLHSTDAMHGELGLLLEGDVLLALSYSGESEELLQLLPAVKRSGVKIVTITASRESSLGRVSDEVILAAVEREACPFNLAPTASTTATLAVGDALAMVLLEARGFKKEDYAKLHPGGAIGRTLLLRVSDIMRSGDRIARVVKGSKVRDAIIAMTKAKSGSVAIVDRENRVAGIFTDGDLRRHLGASANIAEATIDSVMTPHPVTLSKDHLAVDVLSIFQRRNIDDLVIVDSEGKLAGMVDIQDLPKLKIL